MSTDRRTGNGRAVATIRRLRRLSQAELAEALDMSESWMAAVEGGRVRLTGAKLEAVAKALYVEVDAISVATKEPA